MWVSWRARLQVDGQKMNGGKKVVFICQRYYWTLLELLVSEVQILVHICQSTYHAVVILIFCFINRVPLLCTWVWFFMLGVENFWGVFKACMNDLYSGYAWSNLSFIVILDTVNVHRLSRITVRGGEGWEGKKRG
jgi:hypothetical protein